MIARIAVLLAVAVVLGSAANAVSPRSLSWRRPLGKDQFAKIVDAGLVPVEQTTLRQILLENLSRLVDARSREDYKIGRLPGAYSCPWRELEKNTATPPPQGGPIVVYCSNEFCDDALNLGRWLLQHGYKDVGVLLDGYDAWWNARGPVEQD
jgi:rhodanese-related sulfurtransferase